MEKETKAGLSIGGTTLVTLGVSMMQSGPEENVKYGFGLIVLGVLLFYGREIIKPFFDAKRKEK